MVPLQPGQETGREHAEEIHKGTSVVLSVYKNLSPMNNYSYIFFLFNVPQNGTFIVRDSTKIKGEYSLSLWFGGGVRHLR